MTLAQAYTERKSKNLNVFGVVTNFKNDENNLLQIKDESNFEMTIKLCGYCFETSPMKPHYGDILRLHRMRCNMNTQVFECEVIAAVVFEAFISTQTKLVNTTYESKQPTMTSHDYERAFELDQWFAEHIFNNTMSKIDLPSNGYLNLFGQMIATWEYLKHPDRCYLVLWDVTQPSIVVHKPLFDENVTGASIPNFHLIEDREKLYVKLWDEHVPKCLNLNLGDFVILSNAKKQRRGNDFTVELHGNLRFGKWLRRVNGGSTLASLLKEKIQQNLHSIFGPIDDIDLGSPFNETISQRSSQSASSQQQQPKAIEQEATNEDLDLTDLVETVPVVPVAVVTSSVVTETIVAIENLTPSGSGMTKRKSDSQPENLIQEETRRTCGNEIHSTPTRRPNAAQEYPDVAGPSPVVSEIETDIAMEVEHFLGSNSSQASQRNERVCNKKDALCLSCRPLLDSNDPNSSLEVEYPSESSTTLSNSTNLTSMAMDSIAQYLLEARENRPGAVIACVRDYFPNSGNSCLFIQDIVFIKCNCCSFFITIDQALGSQLDIFKEEYLRFISKYPNEVEPDMSIPCLKCESSNTKLLFYLPLKLEDNSKNILWAVLSGKGANKIFETTPLKALCHEYAQWKIVQFFDQLRITCETQQTISKRFTMLKQGTLFEITCITELGDQSFNSSSTE